MEPREEQVGLLLMQVERQELEAILGLRNNRDFGVFMALVARQVERLNERLVMADLDTNQLLCLQGQVRFGVHLMKAVETAPKEFENLQQRAT